MMRLLLVVAALHGAWGQSVPLTVQQVGGCNTSFVIDTKSDGIANVTVMFSRPTTALGWIAIGFSTGNMPSDGLGSDIFMCESDGTVGRYWVTSRTVGAFANKVTVPGGACAVMTVGNIHYKTMNFQRFANATSGTERAIVGTSTILLAFGAYQLQQHGCNDRAQIAVNVIVPPSPGTATTSAPTGANQIITGFNAGAVALGGQVKIGWNLIGTDSVRFAFETPNTFQYVAIGFQNPAVSTKMTGDAIVAQSNGPTPASIGAYTVTYTVAPVPTPGVYFTNGTAYVASGVLHGEFTRTFAAPLTGSVAISDPTNVLVMAAFGNSFPQEHISRVTLQLNLQSGGTNTLAERSPAVAPKVVAIVIIGICAVVGFLFTLGLGHTALGRFCFFRRVCKDSQFLGPRTPMCFDITWGQFTLLTIYFALITLFSRLEFGAADQPRFLRAMGWTSTLTIACASIPVSRHSPLLYFFGMSFERAILIHRILGRTAILIVLMHFVAVLLEPIYQPFRLTQPLVQPYMVDNSLGFWAFMCLLVMFVTSLPQIRRRFFELFYYTHHLFIAVWILAILHNHALVHQLTLIVPLALWAIDRLIRIYRGRLRQRELVSATIVADALRLEFKGDIATCTAAESGSYAFINVPGVSWFQWHPFSISSRGGAPNFTFHIKNMGVGTYTGALHEYFAQNKAGVRVNVDGPYGRSAVRFEEYQSVLLLAGGIGVTPMIAILDDLYEKCKTSAKPPRLESVTFCWSIQTKDSITWMEDIIKKIQATPNPVAGVTFDIQIFVTRSKEESPMYKAGRPKLQAVFESAARPKDGAGKEWRVGVLACGPEPMVVECQRQSMEVGYDFHKEIFAF